MKKFLPAVVAVLALLVLSSAPATATVERPVHNESGLSFFSCGATRPDPPGPDTGADLTVNHSHRIASKSSPGHYDWFDCEGFVNPGQDGCVWATYYIYDEDESGEPIGIFGPFNVTCFGFD